MSSTSDPLVASARHISCQYVGKSSSNSQLPSVSLSRSMDAMRSESVIERSSRKSISGGAGGRELLSSSASTLQAGFGGGSANDMGMPLDMGFLEEKRELLRPPTPAPPRPAKPGPPPPEQVLGPSCSFSSFASFFQKGHCGGFPTRKSLKNVEWTISCKIGCSCAWLATCTASTSHVSETSSKTLLSCSKTPLGLALVKMLGRI
mmetsp:Transcript_89351/g.168314  ORF Transcript_89351/g.168314 Transcript_89351/m.168314 type:complete len:205 (-) Transcript_89351:226-840(-)